VRAQAFPSGEAPPGPRPHARPRRCRGPDVEFIVAVVNASTSRSWSLTSCSGTWVASHAVHWRAWHTPGPRCARGVFCLAPLGSAPAHQGEIRARGGASHIRGGNALRCVARASPRRGPERRFPFREPRPGPGRPEYAEAAPRSASGCLITAGSCLAPRSVWEGGAGRRPPLSPAPSRSPSSLR
jgi:hypothetical protein